MKLIYGTGNVNKKEQVESFFKAMSIDVEITSLKEIKFDREIIENGTTFEENSLIKALAIKEFCDEKNIKGIIVTDDSGLCVNALNGLPGVHSARYAGDHAPQEVTLKKLLDEMEKIKSKDRSAKFECVLTAILEDGQRIVAKGETLGRIKHKPGPMGKLTYGPIFVPDGFDRCLNELKPEELGNTHREKAFLELIEKIKEVKGL